MNEPIRAFVAFEIPAEVKAAVEEWRSALQPTLPRARWVRVESQHLTLKFLGETSRPVLDRFVAELEPRIGASGPVTVALAGAGFFPSPRRPRVAWIGGRADGVEPVVNAVETAGARVGFAREKRPWSLHLTQARLGERWSPGEIDRFLSWGDELLIPAFQCREVVLFESRLDPGGAVYTALERMPLE
jgi:2'-5' RNA ligase